ARESRTKRANRPIINQIRMTNRLPSLLVALLVGSGMLVSPGVGQARHHHHEKAAAPAKTFPTAEATIAALHMDRPPRTSFEVNIVLQNPTPQPLWFLVPLALPLKTGNQISAFEEHRTELHHTEITIGRTLGLWAFQVLFLGPGTKVKLARLNVSYWG